MLMLVGRRRRMFRRRILGSDHENLDSGRRTMRRAEPIIVELTEIGTMEEYAKAYGREKHETGKIS